ncbi:MAG: hypothetical protein ACD_49C00051G0025 [uncultured bacterium (gcode 4)]|uniref:Phospholipid/glycerol acyltransferase domain-containing protein n=1 Tax=uncultured bacterium (gcode 4) TaxID=1234023 RepID=K2AX68_9BACT|nr:MAG: hypothetical protein ACD_49C00051G0025 [uncultured bacterium (gcode 4)]
MNQKNITLSESSISLREQENSKVITLKRERNSLLVKLLLKHPFLMLNLFQLKSLCNNKDLSKWTWIYKNYKFSWKNGLFESLWIDFNNTSSIDLFLSREFIEFIIDKWLENNALLEVQEALHKVIRHFIEGIIIDKNSKKNLNEALELSLSSWKKIIFLSNHVSHLDWPIIDYIFSKQIPISKKIRFLAWSYMFYNKYVRPFSIWFNTTFVFWPKDLENILRRIRSLERNSRIKELELINKFQEEVIKSINWNPDYISLIFPYAGRSSLPHWCKEKIIPWMNKMLTIDNSIYVPIGFWNIWKIFTENNWGWWDLLKNLDNFSPQKIKINVWKLFLGWEYDLKQIHNTMLDISKKVNDIR